MEVEKVKLKLFRSILNEVIETEVKSTNHTNTTNIKLLPCQNRIYRRGNKNRNIKYDHEIELIYLLCIAILSSDGANLKTNTEKSNVSVSTISPHTTGKYTHSYKPFLHELVNKLSTSLHETAY